MTLSLSLRASMLYFPLHQFSVRHVPSQGARDRQNRDVTTRSEFDRLRELRTLPFLATHSHDLSQPLVDGMSDLPSLQPAI